MSVAVVVCVAWRSLGLRNSRQADMEIRSLNYVIN